MPDASFLSSDLFLLTLTVGLYCLGGMIYRRTRLPLLHPVLLTFVAVIVFLRCAGIGYERYRDATGILNFALGMSVVALGYLLYEQLERLRGSLLPVGIATLAGCVVGVLSVVYIAMAFGAERHGYIDDAQHPDDASRERGYAHGKQASAQTFQLFVEQVSERYDRHAEGEIEDARGVAVTLVADSCAAQEDDHGDERQQHGMQQRQPRAAVDHPSEAVKPHGEGQQEEVRGEE